MYQTEDYQSLNSQGLICLQLMSDTHYSSPKVGYSLLSLFFLVFDRLATTSEHEICRLQELCGSLLATEVVQN